MTDRKNSWDPFAVDDSGTECAVAPDGGILFPDHSAFQFDANDPAAAASDWSDVAVDVDFVDGMLVFGDTDGSKSPPDTSSPDDAGIATVQNLGPANLDWRITPDFDDDPGWVHGSIPWTDQAPRTTDDIAPPGKPSQYGTAIETLQTTGLVGALSNEVCSDPRTSADLSPLMDVLGRVIGPPLGQTSASTSGSEASRPSALLDETPTSLDETPTSSVNWWLL